MSEIDEIVARAFEVYFNRGEAKTKVSAFGEAVQAAVIEALKLAEQHVLELDATKNSVDCANVIRALYEGAK